MGVPLPDDAVTVVAAIVDDIRAQGLPAGARDVRWVRLDGLHLTLRFLGPTPETLLDPTADAVAAAAAAVDGPIGLELTGAGSFPRAARPRTLWVGIGGDTEGLSRLAAVTEAALVSAGWSPDDRPFRPHLTLARSDGVSVGPMVAGRLSAAMGGRTIPCTVDRLGLFESVTGGGPARYVALTLAALGPASSAPSHVYHQSTPDPH